MVTHFLCTSCFEQKQSSHRPYLFDEFDAIGSDRARPNEVGEIRRVLNSFLQFVEADDSDSLSLAATNQVEVLDPALFRRFDDVIRYGLPTADAAEKLIRNALNVFTLNADDWAEVRRACDGLSCADIPRTYTEGAKAAILTDRRDLSTKEIQAALGERQAIRQQ